MRKSYLVLFVGLVAMLAVTLVGCPRPLTQAKLYVLLTAGDSAEKALKAEVAIEDIYSLTVTVTEISLVPEGEAQELEGEETAKGNTSHEVVFSGSMDVNLLDLTDVSAVLSSAEVAPGTYQQIRLEIENPRLVLNSDPTTEVTDIQLTANGRLFISGEFEIPAGSEQLLVLDFGGIHLVQTGNGKLVLTPQLRADIQVSDANALIVGTVASVDAGVAVVAMADGTEVEVPLAGVPVFLPTDTDTATGTAADVVVGLTVEVHGLFGVDGSMTVQSVRIYAPEAPAA